MSDNTSTNEQTVDPATEQEKEQVKPEANPEPEKQETEKTPEQPEPETETAPEEVVPEAEHVKRYRKYSVAELEPIVKDLLRFADIRYLELRVNHNEIVVVLPGEFTNIKHLANSLMEPGVFGTRGAGCPDDVLTSVVLRDQFQVAVNTTITMRREYAEPLEE